MFRRLFKKDTKHSGKKVLPSKTVADLIKSHAVGLGPSSQGSVKSGTPSALQLENRRMAEKVLQYGDARADVAGYIESLYTPDCYWYFSATETELTPSDIYEFHQTLWDSFPDMKLERISDFFEMGDDNVVAFRLQVSGTHTGKAFSFGPYLPVPTSGIRCVNDPETMKIFFKDGKIRRAEVHSDSPRSGPAGFYEQIGGIIM